MPTNEELNIADAAFVIEELNRFAAMEPQDVIRHISDHREDALATLRGHTGGIVFCGKAAYDRFEQIADRTVKSGSAEKNIFERRDYVRALRHAFSEVFIEDAQRVTQRTVMQFINRAREHATADLVNVTHHLPCVIFYDLQPDQFSVGPVTFRTTEHFLVDQQGELKRYHESSRSAFAAGLRKRQPELLENQVEAQSNAFADKHIESIMAFYREYDWVASVEIPPTHASISQMRA